MLTLDKGFWYGSFDVGLSTNLSLLIDTGSSDLAVNPDRYKPSSASVNLHQEGLLQYITVFENGCGSANISYSVFNDTMSFINLTVPLQTFASVKPTSPPDNNTLTAFPHDGLAGFRGRNVSRLHATPFFHQLCEQGTVRECRFGLALKSDGTGVQLLGQVDETLASGPFAKATIKTEWAVRGDVRVRGQAVAQNQVLILDSGTANVVGPTAQVMKLFDAAGIQAVNHSLPGFGFSLSTGSEEVFNIDATAFKEAMNGGNNCTATIAGLDDLNSWIVGQSWFQGKYIDFDVTGKSVGIAPLKVK
ncbi:Gastricsin [Colletotrichum chlorophyti]|uniref:Gastricsin n=1 Tax=Colletotrichum chlorophyti TaxID=708187 RepID=A0A1Q8RM79_9PEZI|nr:Gastricsin [Colletotrichum chlorophyti]